jgi:molybdenum cofactor cytidylyltransferase
LIVFSGIDMRGCEAHDAVVLAAEGSEQLGTPKQLLTIGGETLLQRAVRMAKATGPTHLLVVLGAHAERLAPLVTGTAIVFDPSWEEGMASSLRRATAALSGRSYPLLVTMADQPCLTQEHLDKLLVAYDGSCDVVSAYGDALGPPALLRSQTVAQIHTLRGEAAFRRLWTAGHPAAIRRDALGRRLDTPEDLAGAVGAGLLDG